MTDVGLRAHPWKIAYGPADDRLQDFYIPALSRSVAYARSAGYFSSAALSIAATGLAHLIRVGGQMRLLVGAKLTDDDARAIEQGYDLRERLQGRMVEAIGEPVEALQRKRLEAMAWMIARGTLDVRVVVPLVGGRPARGEEGDAYFHAKHGFFTDAGGNQVGFQGSVNESVRGWSRHYEDLAVYLSWLTESGDSRAHLRGVVQRFERLWTPPHTDADWISVPVPQAVLDELVLRYEPSEAPDRDPLEPVKRAVVPTAPDDQDERICLRFVRDAPRLVGARRLAAATAPFTPWPHQTRVANAVADRYPEGFLLADEVGLGKSIELGLVLRQLFLDGRVRRALILSPASTRWQLQEELYEKFVLDVPVFDGAVFKWRDGREEAPATANPWDAHELFIASSQLAKRRDRRDAVLAAAPWDLVAVDEAHHARRKDFLDSTQDRPNNLLRLLRDLRARQRARCVLLMTATPMQVHPVEVFDLLSILGVGGRWGATPDGFLDFFRELRMPRAEDVDWAHVVAMVGDARATGVEIDPAFAAAQQRALGPVGWKNVVGVLDAGDPDGAVRRLTEAERAALYELCRHMTPLRTRIQRNTRELLRKYKRDGLLPPGANICEREPEPVWVPFTAKEGDLYGRVETYISRFYKRYEETRKGLGFVMTVYRKRLTSSFWALRCSLDRRLDFLRGKRRDAGFDEDDLEQAELEFDVDEELIDTDAGRSVYDDEIEFVEGFLRDLGNLPADSKLVRLREELDLALSRRDSVIVFTQYTDTMDYLRESLRGTYGSQIACYSGRGGQVWDGTGWKEISKEELKARFRDGAELKILLGTEAMSEGLNLQTCGVLFNFDMPWNPMRVEQRIGRIDRIGQRYERVWIRNFFYEESVEAEVHRRLADRIGWFEAVVGELQPILARVERVIRDAAMAPRERRSAVLDAGVAELERTAEGDAANLPLARFVEEPPLPREAVVDPVPRADLERVLLGSTATARRFTPHPTIPRAFRLSGRDATHDVTFDPAVFDAHAEGVRLLTFGEPLLDEVLATAAAPDEGQADAVRVLRCVAGGDGLVGWFGVDGDEAVAVPDLAALRHRLGQRGTTASPAVIEEAQASLGVAAAAAEERLRSVRDQLARGEHLARCEEARQILRQATAVDLALRSRRESGLFEEDVTVDRARVVVPEEAVLQFARSAGAPFAPLYRLLGAQVPVLKADAPEITAVATSKERSLRSRAESLRTRAAALVKTLAAGAAPATAGSRIAVTAQTLR